MDWFFTNLPLNYISNLSLNNPMEEERQNQQLFSNKMCKLTLIFAYELFDTTATSVSIEILHEHLTRLSETLHWQKGTK